MIGQLAERDTGVAGNPYDGWSKVPMNIGSMGSSGVFKTGAVCGNPLGSWILINMIAGVSAGENLANHMLRWFESTYLPTNQAYVDYASGTWTPSRGSFSSSNSPLNNAPKVKPGSFTCHGAHTRWKIAAKSWILAKGTDRANHDRCRKSTYATVYKLATLINEWKAGASIDGSVDPTAGGTSAGCRQSACHGSSGYPVGGGASGKIKCTPCHTQRIGDGHEL